MLHPNWKQSWKWFSVHSMAISIALLGAWTAMPDTLQQSLSPKAIKTITIVILVSGIVGRVIKQPSDKE